MKNTEQNYLFLKNVVVFLALLSSLVACNSKSSLSTAQMFMLENYHAHLELDSTTLLVSTVADNLDVPWEIAWGIDNWIWYSTQSGKVIRLNPENGESKVILQIPDVHYQKSRGLLGMALHPNFEKHPYVFVHYTYLKNKNALEKNIASRLVRYAYEDNLLSAPKILLDSIPGRSFHNGSRIAFGPDQKLYLSLGDAGYTEKTQDITSLIGKILRINPDGTVPEDNPFPGSLVWSMGHRNPQGLTFGPTGHLYSSEHGPINDDEVNLIQKGKNYGWPNVHGFCNLENEKKYCEEVDVEEPLFAWTPTIAVSGMEYYGYDAIHEWKNALILANLKGRALRVLKLNENGEEITQENIYFQKHFGRIRAICISPKGDIFLSTSNKDWHPKFQAFIYENDSLPYAGDDRIIRISAADPLLLAALEQTPENKKQLLKEDKMPLELLSEQWVVSATDDELTRGQKLYQRHCSACHQEQGQGVKGMIPPLFNTHWVTGDKDRLIYTVLNGLSAPIEVNGIAYNQEMPGFAAQLNDEETAALLNYIRKSFGNDANSIIAAEVAEERKKLISCQSGVFPK